MFLQIVRNEWRHVAFPVALTTLVISIGLVFAFA